MDNGVSTDMHLWKCMGELLLILRDSENKMHIKILEALVTIKSF